ncbi:MAG: DUF4349 domain-containing protein [Hydrogenophilaceae bacterium]|nr:DUF4349 domain-containing protein [Hydrogenophilaceae bacterium]
MRILSSLFFVVLLAACNGYEAPTPVLNPDVAGGGIADRAIAMEAAPAAAPVEQGQAEQKYLAERQYWVFELKETDIEKRWQSHLALCMGNCEVLNASVSKSTQSPVYANLQLRVPRNEAGKLFAAMESPDVIERRVEREDKTLQVVDVEARLKNLAELRDRLRVLQTQYKGSLKDLLETEKELARVQGELDAMTAQRKVLANETEKILLNADYRPKPSLGETGAFQPLVEAWRNVGRTFAQSLGSALLFLVGALPWVVIVIPVLWGAWKGIKALWAKFRTWRKPA